MKPFQSWLTLMDLDGALKDSQSKPCLLTDKTWQMWLIRCNASGQREARPNDESPGISTVSEGTEGETLCYGLLVA